MCRKCGDFDPDATGCSCDAQIVCGLCSDLKDIYDDLDDGFDVVDEDDVDAAIEALDDELDLEDPDAWKHDATGTP
ncbi:MAG TPA: hypothetical protein VI670_28220 [Thermoanaerobaculia bacterium]